MNISVFRKLVTSVKAASLLSITILGLGLTGCGGGGGGGGETVIAPESLEGVKINFFKAFTMECYRLSGTAGSEVGAAQYVRVKNSFRYAIVAEGGNLGYTIFLPLTLTSVNYKYVRTSSDTGQVTFTFNNAEAYPIAQATKDNTDGPVASGDMFWGGRNSTATELVVDILFTDQGGYIVNTSTRIRSGYLYVSTWTDPGPAVNSEFPFDFDTTEAVYGLTLGGFLPTGYNPYTTITDETPSSVVWVSCQKRTVAFEGEDGIPRNIAFQTLIGGGPAIPGGDQPDESGTILVDDDLVTGVGGTYSYKRTGGDKAKLSIQYGTKSLTYTMTFDTLDSGLYTDTDGNVLGVFEQNLYVPN